MENKTAAQKTADALTCATARTLGNRAFVRGDRRAPHADPMLRAHEGLLSSERVVMVWQAWLEGWDMANLATAGVPALALAAVATAKALRAFTDAINAELLSQSGVVVRPSTVTGDWVAISRFISVGILVTGAETDDEAYIRAASVLGHRKDFKSLAAVQARGKVDAVIAEAFVELKTAGQVRR